MQDHSYDIVKCTHTQGIGNKTLKYHFLKNFAKLLNIFLEHYFLIIISYIINKKKALLIASF